MALIILFWIFAILLILFIVSLLVVGIFFLIKGNQNKMKNLIVLGVGFIAMVIGYGNFRSHTAYTYDTPHSIFN